jgi:hypothetical protein
MRRFIGLLLVLGVAGCRSTAGAVEDAPQTASDRAATPPTAAPEPLGTSPGASAPGASAGPTTPLATAPATGTPAASDTPTGPSSAPRATDVDELGVRWRLEAAPALLTMAQLEQFQLTVRATNQGTSTVDPQHMGCGQGSNPCLSSSWRLNGGADFALGLAFGNGVREQRWSALPPGETVSDSRRMGESLFSAPGRYTITYQHGSATASAEVIVKP